MEVLTNMDALVWLRKHLDEDGSDLLREMVRTFAERLMAAEAEAICNAGYGEVTPLHVGRAAGESARDRDRRRGGGGDPGRLRRSQLEQQTEG